LHSPLKYEEKEKEPKGKKKEDFSEKEGTTINNPLKIKNNI